MDCFPLIEAMWHISADAVWIERVHDTVLHIFWSSGVSNWWEYSPSSGQVCAAQGAFTV